MTAQAAPIDESPIAPTTKLGDPHHEQQLNVDAAHHQSGMVVSRKHRHHLGSGWRPFVLGMVNAAKYRQYRR